jgi:very-short-patch-repair endonuclease
MSARVSDGYTNLEAAFLHYLRLLASDLPKPVSQFAYAPDRRFRADFAYPDARLLIECEGGVFGQQEGKKGKAHGSVSGILSDCERSRVASANGYRVFRITSKDLDETPEQVIALLRQALDHRKEL